MRRETDWDRKIHDELDDDCELCEEGEGNDD